MRESRQTLHVNMQEAAAPLNGVSAQRPRLLRVRPSQHAAVKRELCVPPTGTVQVFVPVDIYERAAAVRAFLVQSHEPVPSWPRHHDLELARGVYEFDSAARLAEFRGAGQVYDDQAGVNSRRIRSHFRQSAAIARHSGRAGAGRARGKSSCLQPVTTSHDPRVSDL
jgi:hypothetical protein